MKLCNVLSNVASLCAFWIAAMLLAAPWTAHAAVISYTDCIAGNPPAETTPATCAGSTDNVLLKAGTTTTSLIYTHDLSNNGFLVGDTVTAATLVIDFNDDGDTGGAEGVDIFIDFNGNNIFEAAEQVANEFNPNGADFSCTDACQTSLIAALADGLTAIRLAVGSTGGPNNDFYFSDSLLTVRAERQDSTQVPEPATLALLGLGLLGIGFARRRKQK